MAGNVDSDWDFSCERVQGSKVKARLGERAGKISGKNNILFLLLYTFRGENAI